MARARDTKEEILRLGMDFIQTYGYNAFSYADIAKKLEIKNAAVHYHYPGKEDLLAGIVDEYIRRYQELALSFKKPGLSARKKLLAFIDRYGQLCEQGKICLIGSVCSDYNTLPESVKERIQELVKLVLGLVENVLKEGRKNGELRFKETPRLQAMLFMTQLAAGVQLSRITGHNDYNAICRSLLRQLTD